MGGRNIAKSYAISLLSVISALLINLILLKEVNKLVDREIYGLFVSINSVSQMLSLLMLGFDHAAALKIAESLGKNNFVEANRICRQLSVIAYVISVCLIIATSLFFVIVSVYPVSAKPDQSSLIKNLVTLSVFNQAFSLCNRGQVAALISSGYNPFVNLFRLFQQLFYFAFALVLLYAGIGIYCMPIAEIGGSCIYVGSSVYGQIKYCQWATGKVENLWLDIRRNLAAAGIMFSVSMFGLLENVIETAALQFLTPNGNVNVATHNIWTRFPLQMQQLGNMLTYSSVFVLAGLYAQSRESAEKLIAKVTKSLCVIFGLSSLAVALWLPGVVSYWMTEKYDIENGKIYSILLVMGVSFRGFLAFLMTVSNSCSRQSLTWKIALSVLVGKVLLCLFFVPFAGLIGLALTVTVSSIISGVLTLYWFRKDGSLPQISLSSFSVAMFFAGLIVLLCPVPLKFDSRQHMIICLTISTVLLIPATWAGFQWAKRSAKDPVVI